MSPIFDPVILFLHGVALGLVIAVPVGPVGLLCIRRTAERGLVTGFMTGIGAALADALFVAIAAFGITAAIDFIHRIESGLKLGGSLVLLGMAWHLWRKPPQPLQKLVQENDRHRWLSALSSGLALTLTNPVTLFATIAVVATLGAGETHAEAVMLVLGALTGSALWWFILSGSVALVRHKLSEHTITRINRVTATILAGVSIWILVVLAGKWILGQG
jgi:arginine exporter protein ArgO